MYALRALPNIFGMSDARSYSLDDPSGVKGTDSSTQFRVDNYGLRPSARRHRNMLKATFTWALQLYQKHVLLL